MDGKSIFKLYEVIYHLLEDVEEEIKLLKSQEKKSRLIGKLEVLKVFRREKNNMIMLFFIFLFFIRKRVLI